jgi:hypothetical protein
MMPFILRAALLRKIGSAFDFAWCLDFIKRTGFMGFLYVVGMALISVFIVLVGFAACFVGLYFALPVMLMFQTHVYIQMYQLYLDRGGSPLELPDENMSTAFPVQMPPPVNLPPQRPRA